jgi:hypothetical protein
MAPLTLLAAADEVACSFLPLLFLFLLLLLQMQKLEGYKQRLDTALKGQKEAQKNAEKLEKQLAAQQDQAAQRASELQKQLAAQQEQTSQQQKLAEKLEKQLAVQQDQSAQRVAELKEAYKLDQQAKAHMAGAYEVCLSSPRPHSCL